MGCSYACLEIKMMLDELICKYEAAMGIMLSQQPANLSAFKSHFAVLDNIFMAAYVHVCGSALYDVLEKHEAEWLCDCMMHKARCKRQHVHEMLAFQLVRWELGPHLSALVKDLGGLYMVHDS